MCKYNNITEIYVGIRIFFFKRGGGEGRGEQDIKSKSIDELCVKKISNDALEEEKRENGTEK